MATEQLASLTNKICTFLQNRLAEREDLGCRSFYSESFSLSLLNRAGVLDDAAKAKLLAAYEALDHLHPEFHWEFNNYAFLDYLQRSSDQRVAPYLNPLRFKNTPCTNWTLLRSNCRLAAGTQKALAVAEAKEKIDSRQLDSGLILDDPGVKSFQYHCFSMAMIAEIYAHTGDGFFLESFYKGLRFIRNFILSNGEALYIGRGQKQSFGYGSLIYICALGYRYTSDPELLGDIQRITSFIMQHIREDGSLPLVFNGLEHEIPKVVDMKSPEYAGWYPYNNYFDYLAFLGLFLHKSLEILADSPSEAATFRQPAGYRDKDFLKVVIEQYEAVISRPGGYWTNDQPIPYVVSRGSVLTPCYGGEQFQESLYSLKGIPLPFCAPLQRSIRWRSLSWLDDKGFWLVSPLGTMRRRFFFEKERITIDTQIFSLLPFRHYYLFSSSQTSVCENLDDLTFEGTQYSASGPLSLFSSRGRRSTVVLKVSQ